MRAASEEEAQAIIDAWTPEYAKRFVMNRVAEDTSVDVMSTTN